MTPEDVYLRHIIDQALEEDFSSHGDITSQAIFTPHQNGDAIIESKEPGIIAGSYLINLVYKTIDPQLHISIQVSDGDSLSNKTQIAHISGSYQSICSGERVVLNFLQHLSGIATRTKKLTSMISSTEAKLLDTRKTTPGLRLLEKKAVVAGGGFNHRMGLFDMILIKDTHVKASNGPYQAVIKAKQFLSTAQMQKQIEVEVQTIDEFKEALKALPDRIMLDNMSVDDMMHCVELKNKSSISVELEASGNIKEDSILKVAKTGVEYISCGSLTHSVKALDIHLILL